MMPAYCPDTAPPGEQAVYAALATAAETDGWIVLHSLGIADHVRQIEGEADFVVIVPGKGVLVIEVKSHRRVDLQDDGRWKLGKRAPTIRSPFQQAREALYSIRSYLKQRHIDLRSIPMLYAVWFTHVRARTMLPQSPEWHDWQVLDSEDLRAGAPAAVLRALAAGRAHRDEKIQDLHDRAGLDSPTTDRIASLLRPRFEMHIVAAELRRARNSQLITFIEEQYLALDAMADNKTVLFTGPAGSGKTLLAMEAARREAAQGHQQGRLLCFNRLLGRRLASDLSDVAGVTVRTFHQELLRLAGIEPPPGAGPGFWEYELPDLAIEALLNRGDEEVSDFLVIDEIQDIAREPYLDVLDLMVDGGLERGRLLSFGDFERQAIFETEDGRDLLKSRCTRLVRNRLTANCRNLPRIGYAVNAFSRLEPGYRRFRRQDDGVDPTFVAYKTSADQSALVAESVRKLRDEGYDLNEIAVLSPLRSGSVAETATDPWLRQILHPADGMPPRPGQLQYCTIHAFKGLEAPALVVTDLDRNLVPNFELLLYVGLTRATDRLFAVIESGTLRAALGGNA